MELLNKIAELFVSIKRLLHFIPGMVQEVLQKARPIIQQLKDIIESDDVDAIVKATPGLWDDMLQKFGSELCQWLLDQYQVKSLHELIEHTKNMPLPDRHGRFAKINSLLISKITGVKESQADWYTQTFYIVKNK